MLAQAEDEGDDATKEAATTLVFSEFLEAVARAAHNKWKHRTKTGLHVRHGCVCELLVVVSVSHT